MLKLMLRIVYTHTGLFFTSSGRGPFCSIYGHSIIKNKNIGEAKPCCKCQVEGKLHAFTRGGHL